MPEETRFYTPAGFYMLRTPALPADFFSSSFRDSRRQRGLLSASTRTFRAATTRAGVSGGKLFIVGGVAETAQSEASGGETRLCRALALPDSDEHAPDALWPVLRHRDWNSR